MQGLDVIRNANTRNIIEDILKALYTSPMNNLYNLNQLEDLVLFTSRREEFANIGTDAIQISKMQYILDNVMWMGICLFVNEDFRKCFDDAIAIEKALLQVTDLEYKDFRDDMTLESDDEVNGKSLKIDIEQYNPDMAALISKYLKRAIKNLKMADFDGVYKDLINTISVDTSDSFDPNVLESIRYVIHNYVYVINAMNRNGFFNKYVRLVIDNVKFKLTGTKEA